MPDALNQSNAGGDDAGRFSDADDALSDHVENSVRQLPISDEDIRAIVALLGRVASMSEPLDARRRALLDGVCQLVDGDIWMWLHSKWEGDRPVMALSHLDAGWQDDDERNRIMHANSRAEVGQAIFGSVRGKGHYSVLFDESHPGWGDGRIFHDVIAKTGLTRLMFSFYELPDQVLSGIGIHRRAGKPKYTPRELAIFHLITGQIDWLHRIDLPPIASTPSLHLTDRERELLMHLLSGDGRKQIARKMGISEHTVGGHMKSLYRQFNINSRSELMSMFLPVKMTATTTSASEASKS